MKCAYCDGQVLGSVAGLNASVIVQVIPLPRREVCWDCVGGFQQDGRDHNGISQHPLPVDEEGCSVCWPAEEQRAHD